jgi:hypothetical protein
MTPSIIPNCASGDQKQPSPNVAVSIVSGILVFIGGWLCEGDFFINRRGRRGRREGDKLLCI